MRPAFSVILFTTLSGTGFGLWCWLGLRIAAARMLTPFEPIGWAIGLILGAALVAAGVIASLWHLGRPLRVWRAFSQWRSSWMSREGVASVAALAAALATFAGLMFPGRAAAGSVAAALLAALSLAAVYCTAMIYASLPPIPAWRHRLVVPGYLGFALVGGLFPFRACVLLPPLWSQVVAALLVLGPLALAVLKRRYWHDLDRTPLPFTRGDAVGLPGRDVSVFEGPSTDATYVAREMGFALARKHAAKLRRIALALFALLPALCAAVAWALPSATLPALVAAAIAFQLGAIVERWLFFAEAKHVVSLYY
ncbi:MAG: dimethyl sulfoxide reductase anchor subunit [Xanthomonadales bacterium]|nr:dimethyl sulfoxide reductase anchor subunit [Xanthomonadales bacterium]